MNLVEIYSGAACIQALSVITQSSWPQWCTLNSKSTAVPHGSFTTKPCCEASHHLTAFLSMWSLRYWDRLFPFSQRHNVILFCERTTTSDLEVLIWISSWRGYAIGIHMKGEFWRTSSWNIVLAQTGACNVVEKLNTIIVFTHLQTHTHIHTHTSICYTKPCYSVLITNICGWSKLFSPAHGNSQTFLSKRNSQACVQLSVLVEPCIWMKGKCEIWQRKIEIKMSYCRSFTGYHVVARRQWHFLLLWAVCLRELEDRETQG